MLFKKRFYQYLATATANLSILTIGQHYAWPSPALPKLLNGELDYPVSNSEGSTIATLMLVGDILGSCIQAVCLNRIGRKLTILLCGPLHIASWILIANPYHIYVLFVARLIGGIGNGIAFSSVMSYVAEIAESRIRGFLSSSSAVVLVFGMLIVQFFGLYFSISIGGYISCIPAIIFVITFPFMPESPYYLVMKDNQELAKKKLQLLRGSDDVDYELERITQGINEELQKRKNLLDLFKFKGNRKAGFIASTLLVFQQLSGVSAFNFYAKIVFEQTKSDLSSEVASIIFFGIKLVMTVLSSLLLDVAGRKPMLLVSLAGNALTLCGCGVYFYLADETDVDTTKVAFLAPTLFILSVVMFSIGLQTVPLLLIGELFSTSIKGFALFVFNIFFNLVALLTAKFFQYVMDEFGIFVPFFVFGGCCLVGIFFSYWFVPETKGQTLEEIQLVLARSLVL